MVWTKPIGRSDSSTHVSLITVLFVLHIALFNQVIFRSAPQGSRGILRGKQREKIPFQPFNG